MRLLWVLGAAVAGPLLGALTGFGAALVAMSLGPSRTDGTYGMREMLVCVPVGLLAGLAFGIWLALRFSSP